MFLKILKVIGVLILILLIVGLFVKKEHFIEREVVISKPKAQIFNYVKFLKNQNEFSKWAKMDPNMKTSFSGVDGTVGFTSSWDSDKSDVGKGEQTIEKIVEGEELNYKLHFIKPFEGIANATILFKNVTDSSTKVSWSFKNKIPYPMNIMCLFMDMDKEIGNDLSTGLKNLKAIMEK